MSLGAARAQYVPHAVTDDDAVVQFYAETLCRHQENIGIWLGLLDVIGGYDWRFGGNMQRLNHALDSFPVAAGRNCPFNTSPG